jgi:hypothetical protein
MTSQAIQRTIQPVCTHLSADVPAAQVSFEELKKRRRVPALSALGWGPDYCIERGDEVFLMHILSGPELPPWVRKSRTVVSKKTRVYVIAVALKTKELPALKIAEQVCEACASSKFGLLCQTQFGFVTVLPPRRFQHSACNARGTEHGHVPKWIIDRLLASEGFSASLKRHIRSFNAQYRKLTRRVVAQMYDRESDILEDFLRRVRRSAAPFYLPIDGFVELKNWERRGAHPGARDHYFHTFNNLLLGLLILGEVFGTRAATESPDRFIMAAGQTLVGQIKPWEFLWFLTCLNHDPGYMGEKLWPTLRARYGLAPATAAKRPIPPDFAESLVNGWDTDLLEARTDLKDLYDQVRNVWAPPRTRTSTTDSFDEALGIAYFDGERFSHSLLSGLTLIQGFIQDATQAELEVDLHNKCLAGCEIAALSMLFHDQRCRELLQSRNVPPIPFEQLPYASLLIFVDAIQDDRRDIAKHSWPTHGVLNALEVIQARTLVRARVCLREIPLRYWPSKLAEYDSALRWLNSSAQIRFEIDHAPDVAF